MVEANAQKLDMEMVDRIGWAAINHINQFENLLLDSERTRRGKRMIMEYERTLTDLDEEKKQQEKLKKKILGKWC
ncbi:unnamed protein product [Caenorhabditis angaria]|uniref:Uncharacterized protein n=1 Tax=Caenorhabditis angaria TaxID=860376 RepID=A0A9P1ND09_9PELO|nr:unnamed protein product [Caenorhabditis angaria]